MSWLVRFLAVVALVGAVTFVISGADASDDGAKRRASHRLGSEWRPDFQAAKRYANGRSGQVRFMIVDPFGRSHRLHHTGTAPMASLFKALLLATYLSEPNVRHRSLRDWERDLLGPMIKRSDDEAATRVRDIVGAGSVKGTARQADMQDFKYDPIWGLSRSSPRDQAHFFLRLERFIPERHEGYAKRLLAGIVRSQRWGVGRVHPDGWKLYFKGGWGDASGRVDHQTALYVRGGCRVALSIMTEHNPNHHYGTETLEGVAQRLMRGFGGVECSAHRIRRRAHAPGLQVVPVP